MPDTPETGVGDAPATASNDVITLDVNGKRIYLIGTAHVSQRSADLVRAVVEETKPNSICIELDKGRYEALKNPQRWKETDLVRVIKDKRVGFLLAQLILGGVQKKIASNMDTKVGGEMLAGMECAEQTGAQLVLADRDIQVTFMRIWRKLSFFKKIKLIFSLLFSFDDDEATEISEEKLKELLNSDLLDTAMAELKKDYPEIGQILLHERDQYLAKKIREAPGKTVVAVLGAAHVPGVSEEIFKNEDLTEIETVPPKHPASKVVGWIIPVIIIGLLVYAFAINVQTGLRQLSVWVVWNSGLAALGTLCALGNPLSILTAAVAAPFTSVNPFLACGWFAGLVEAHMCKPRVQDLETLPEDVLHFKKYYSNRFLKSLLVVIFANIGSTAGTIVAGLDIVKNLF